jgi:SAM-dependent methyltransferase
MSLEDALQEYRSYFDARIERYGAVPEGVDYNGLDAQRTRFEQLAKVIDPSGAFDLIDYGCGYGALFGFLRQKGWNVTYHGYDMLPKMVRAAREANQDFPNADFTDDEAALRPCDYLIAGAIFNNKFNAPVNAWRDHTLAVLGKMSQLSLKGFAFNMLTNYSEPERMARRPDLYFADPLFYFDHCKRNYSRDVALLHDYGLYDFTILVRKQA